MGQHSRKPSSQDHKPSPQDRKPTSEDRKPSHQARRPSAAKRRWGTVAVSAAVLAAASTTAWAAIGNDDSSTRTAALTPPAPKPSSSPAPRPPGAAAQPNLSTPAPSKSSGPAPSKTPSTAEASPPAAASSSAASTPSAVAESKVKTRTAKARTTRPKYRVLSTGNCGASYYGEPQMTASGERFNPAAMTAAHKTLPLGSKVRVTNPNNGESVTVRINDRGPYVGGRCLDLSRAAFAAIGNIGAGVMRVKYEVLGR
ncbi:septal ring lytic transglycosylase RlpA family protein [Nonomuraea composti]|uniref:septal ring lytic transglycosylase RlpA family protein n=1 Tax=Nonomuraea composti TaxID=2720023 RepID=UPI001F1086F6|nr:septal ring lytic transglycosylase RlpA family protein [Nonomuraea sp. FMUSA5-5]